MLKIIVKAAAITISNTTSLQQTKLVCPVYKTRYMHLLSFTLLYTETAKYELKSIQPTPSVLRRLRNKSEHVGMATANSLDDIFTKPDVSTPKELA